jgi:hypothetical protein
MIVDPCAQQIVSRENRILDADTEADLCEACYQWIVKFGLEHVLTGLGRAARLRAGDYIQASRRQYLRHQRASSMIMSACQDILEDSERVEEIVDQERSSSPTISTIALAQGH